MDETYIHVMGEWTYLYRAVDKARKTACGLCLASIGCPHHCKEVQEVWSSNFCHRHMSLFTDVPSAFIAGRVERAFAN